MMLSAIDENRKEGHESSLTCIEPFEMPWLEQLSVKVIRDRVELLDVSIFKKLQSGDILFIDSSHIIRPEGDVLFEIFEILPNLASGVYIHFHDILTPYHYPENWLKEEYRFWNEQYLLEAFLTHNEHYEVIGGIRYLTDHFPAELMAKFPATAKNGSPSGSSFWIRKR
jgi:hypothetical protein